MKRLPLIFTAALFLAVFAAFSLPARLLPRLVGSDVLGLSGLSGTVVRGSAARALLRTPAGVLHLGRLSWDLHPVSLLSFSPRAHISSHWGAQRLAADVRIDGRRIVLSDLDASGDARLLRTLMPVAAGGRISLQFERLVLEDELPLEADGRIVWQDARWQAPQASYALGTYAAVVTVDEPSASAPSPGRVVRARIETLAGPVSAAGAATLDGPRFDVDVLIGAAGQPLQVELERALRLIARPEEDGYRLRLDGSFASTP